jgi:DNA-binding response OmpR family regulator
MIPHRKRILIIDDSPTSLVWQLVLLQEAQYDTITASTLDEGVRIAKLELPDLVILDAATRHAEVLASADALRADPQTGGIPILVLSPKRFLGRPRKAVGQACDDQVYKPLQGTEYLRKVCELLGRRAEEAKR